MALSLLAIGLVLTWTAASQAYDPATHAQLLTRYAWYQYLRCTGGKPSAFSREELEAGNRAQDASTVERMLNWHFHYRAGIQNGIIDRSAESILAKRAEQLEQAIALPDSLEVASGAVGAILHYLQDMTVPAHAVPVFHVGEDPFDHFWGQMSTERRIALRRQLTTPCARMVSRAQELSAQGVGKVARALYEEAAADTMGALSAAIPSQPTLDWGALWPKHRQAIDGQTCHNGCLYEREEVEAGGSAHKRNRVAFCINHDGFGCYNPQRSFGQADGDPAKTAESDSFFVARATKAVEVSTVFLLYLTQ